MSGFVNFGVLCWSLSLDRRACDQYISELDSILNPCGLECIEVEWVDSENVLRIYIDILDPADAKESMQELGNLSEIKSDKNRATAELCKKATRIIQDQNQENSVLSKFDHLDFMLEVSSPGVERPLRKLSQFAKFAGTKAAMYLATKGSSLKSE